MPFKLLPSADFFFDLFNDAAENARQCVNEVKNLADNLDDSADQFLKIKELEKKGDALTADILAKLETSFITPFDREDIHALTEAIDDVVDESYGLADLINLMRPTKSIPELSELVGKLCVCADEMCLLVADLRTKKNIREVLTKISVAESEGDTIYRQTMARLFGGDFDAMDILKWKDIIQAAEAAINRIETVSDVVESIVVKHA